MKIIDYLYLYRIISWQGRTPWTRGLAYVALGYATAAEWLLLPLLINFLIISGLAMSAFALNDFFDYKLNRENNFIGKKLQSGELSSRQVGIISALPLLALGLIIFLESRIAQILLIAFFLITLLYNLPPFRLKNKSGWIYSPVCAVIGFLESFFVLGQWNLSILGLTILVALFHFYTEMVHILEEFQTGERQNAITQKRALVFFRFIPWLSLLTGLVFMPINYVFTTAVFFSAVRIIAGWKIDLSFNFYKLHRRLLSLVYSSYEFGVYIIAGAFGSFN